jgi:hypothetical protein
MRISLRHLLLSTSSLFGVYVAFHEIVWFWSANASTASDGHIVRVLIRAAFGCGIVVYSVIDSIRVARTQERLHAELLVELRAGRTGSLPAVTPSVPSPVHSIAGD